MCSMSKTSSSRLYSKGSALFTTRFVKIVEKFLFDFVLFSVSVERMRSFDRGSIELPRLSVNENNQSEFEIDENVFVSEKQQKQNFVSERFYALYNYNGTINNTNGRSQGSRLPERHLHVNEGDELEVIEDDDEHLWRVKNLRTNEIGLIPSTLIGHIDGDLQRSSIISVSSTFSLRFDCFFSSSSSSLERFVVDGMSL